MMDSLFDFRNKRSINLSSVLAFHLSTAVVARCGYIVGEIIRTKRKERGLSQEGLAKAVGLKRPSMSNIPKGKQNILLYDL